MSTALYQLVSEIQLREYLQIVNACFELPVQLLDQKGTQLQRYGNACQYCKHLQSSIFTKDFCIKTQLQAGKQAHALGESYIFSCTANVNAIVFPLVHQSILLGSIIIGPFLMDVADSTIITDLAERYDLSAAHCLALYDEVQTLPVVAPVKVTHISKLIDLLFMPLMSDQRAQMQANQAKLHQQSKISSTIQMYKGLSTKSTPSDYIYHKEQELMRKVKRHDLQASKAVLNDLLGFVLFCEGQDLAIIKNRALELTTLLSRVSIEGGAPPRQIYEMTNRYLSVIQEISQFEVLCATLQEVVDGFVSSLSIPLSNHGSAMMRKAVQYIGAHFHEPLSIDHMASYLSLSPSYFSTFFAKNMNMGFHAYLTSVRIEESKNLLTATDFPISQIAISVGYADQSSFTKAFKRTTGVTPHSFR